MNLFKITALTVLCLFNVGLFGQDQQSHVKQLEYDIMTWKTRAKVVADVKGFAFNWGVGCILPVVATISFLLYKNFGFESKDAKAILFMISPFFYGFQMFSYVYLGNWMALKYINRLILELENNRKTIAKVQKLGLSY